MFYQIQGFENRGKVLGGSYEIEIVRTLFLKLEKNVCQLFFRDFFSKSLAADGIILAITTAQSTAAEKNCSASVSSADAGFFPVVKSRPCNLYLTARTTVANGFSSICVTTAGTERTSVVVGFGYHKF